jgi:tetratricopeptide (TPR) repeat protein
MRNRSPWSLLAFFVIAVSSVGCGEDFAISGQTVGLVRLVRPGVVISLDDTELNVLHDARLIRDVTVSADRTGRAIVLLDGGGRIVLDAGGAVKVGGMDAVELLEGRMWVEAGEGEEVTVTLAGGGRLRASASSASVVLRGGELSTYSASGELTYDLAGGSGVAREGEILEAAGDRAEVRPAELWTDWTGGLAEAGPQPSATPTGIGEIFARRPGSLGVTRLPLVIRRHDVRVTIQGDLAVTETVQEFFNPASDTLEGVYKLRIPRDAVLQRFAVDRDGRLVDGTIKEKQKARSDYQSHVYEGSTHDPALLEWTAPGTFEARIYPIEAGEVRLVAYRYVQWLRPSGEEGDTRSYVLPMGSATVPPSIGEFSLMADLEDVGTSIVQAGLGARIEEGKVVFNASDFRPKSDFWLELLQVEPDLDGKDARMVTHAYDAPEGLLNETDEERYFYTQLMVRPEDLALEANRDLRVAVVSDLSAATDTGLADLGLTFVDSLLRQMDEEDSIAVLAGDLSAAPMGLEGEGPVKATAAAKERAIDALSRRSTGGATDIGELITQAAQIVGSEPGGVVIYVGDAFPTVGEMDLSGLLERLSKLPHAVRLYGVALGDEANVDLLAGLCEGSGLSMRVSNRVEAAETAYRLLADASVPVFTEVTYEIEGEVERLYPRRAVTLRIDEPLSVIGRISGDDDPEAIRIEGRLGDAPFETRLTLDVEEVDDHGDLRLRWASRRLEALRRADAGREALVELGTRFQIVTPYTSFYVPPADEAASLPARPPFEIFTVPLDGDGERGGLLRELLSGAALVGMSLLPYGCKMMEGEETQSAPDLSQRLETEHAEQAKESTQSIEQEATVRQEAVSEDFRSGGREQRGRGAAAPEKPAGDSVKRKVKERRDKNETLDGLLSVLGGGGEGDYDAGSGEGYGRKSTWMSDAEAVALTTSESPESLQGPLDARAIEKVARANRAAIRACYEDQLAVHPELAGRVKVEVVVGASGAVLDADVAGSTLDNDAAESCILAQVRSWTFPAPAGTGASVVAMPFNFRQGTDIQAELGSYDNFGAAANELNLQVQMSQQLIVQQNALDLVDNNASYLRLQARKSVCTAESRKPLADKVAVWSERLGATPGVDRVVAHFNQARRNCEIRTMQDRRAFARLALRRLEGPPDQCLFMKRMQAYPDLVDYIRKKILAGVTTTHELSLVRQVCDDATLADEEETEEILESNKSHDEKIKAIKKLIKIYPTDMEIKLVLLSLLEDAPGDERLGEARRLAERLRHHPYADDRVRTRVGEFYIRIGKAGEAKRCFSEIVEFAPYSPAARRRLGDLYRTYGWHEDAYRQYETLSDMVPSDESVLILLAEAAARAGRLDEAVRLAERVSQTAGSGGVLTAGDVARVFNGLRLAALRIEAREDGDEDEVKDLMKRSRRAGVLRDVSGLEAVLKWSHPDVHLDLLVRDEKTEIRPASMIAEPFGVEWLRRSADRPGELLLAVVRAEGSIVKESRGTLHVLLGAGGEDERLVTLEVDLTDPETEALAWSVSPGGEVETAEVPEEEPIGFEEVSR